jgi:hypothetical protein
MPNALIGDQNKTLISNGNVIWELIMYMHVPLFWYLGKPHLRIDGYPGNSRFTSPDTYQPSTMLDSL